jgi:hypothetical protein
VTVENGLRLSTMWKWPFERGIVLLLFFLLLSWFTVSVLVFIVYGMGIDRRHGCDDRAS